MIEKLTSWILNRSDYMHHDTEELSMLELLGKLARKTNELTEVINDREEFINDFVSEFEPNLQDKISTILTNWKETGLLDTVINSALSGEIQTVKQTLENEVSQINGDISGVISSVNSFKNNNTTEHNNINSRINNIITTPAEGVSAQEIIDARQGADSLYQSLENIKEASIHRRGGIGESENLDDVTGIGMYSCISTSLPQNWPSNNPGILVVFKPHPTLLSRTVQIVVDTAGKLFVRSSTSKGYRDFIEYVRSTHIDMANYVKHADSYNKCIHKWTTRQPLPYMVSSGTYGEYPAGTTVEGLPYSSVFYAGNDILFNKNINTFYSAIENPASVLYTEVGGDGENNRAGVYGIVCSSLVGWLCGQDIYRITIEMETVIDFYDYQDLCDVRPGDVLLAPGHAAMVYDVECNNNGDVEYVWVLESKMPTFTRTRYNQSGFENRLEKYGGTFKIGRYPDYKPRTLPKIQYATDCIPDLGDKTVYKDGQEVWLYVSNGAEQIHYKRKEDISFTVATLSTLENKLVNGVTVYNITPLLNETGIWEVTTNPNGEIYCTIMIVTTGDVNVNGYTVEVNGYSEGIKPLWYQIIRLHNKPSPQGEYFYHKPEGWYANSWHHHKYYIDQDPTFPEPEECEGYYIRVHYDTPYGQIYKDSEYIFF